MNYHFSFDIFYLSSIPSLNGKEGGTLAGWRGPGYGQLRQVINLDPETTSKKPPKGRRMNDYLWQI